MLFLILAGCVAASTGVVEDNVAATAHSGGFSQATIRAPRGKWGVTRFKDGKPVEEPPAVAEAPVVEAPPPATAPPRKKRGAESLGAGAVPEAPVVSIPGLELDATPKAQKPRAVTVRGVTLAEAPILSAQVIVGDGDADAIRLAELVFGFTLATPTPEVAYYDEP